ncbi:GNAT family N-acetyltransferase [Oceanirhabdus sp. W0125-5]|uniref:GNAT family N-acetyltransferase n=1 Tax=Oceanirhabdus sp. W0125-5 TaxID=2999116 RepID=UPI0022F2BFBD|nr:GNAT family N-acetyltransferase [Oceanirhabdus sp. W0125-5]WBW95876.1 GNAT family N-acetyltransferase [Oceanirhabdus sp. W0125-5]
MLSIYGKLDNYHITSVGKEDLDYMHKWYNHQQLLNQHESRTLNKDEFYDSFLGYVISNQEFFLKISIEDRTVGMVKGHLNNEEKNELWLTDVIMDKEVIEEEVFKKLIDGIIKILDEELNIDECYVGVFISTEENRKRWNKNGFNHVRTVHNYFSINNVKIDGEIMVRGC